MTPAELREVLKYYSDDEDVAVKFMARELDVSAVRIWNWLQDRARIPRPAAVAITLLRDPHGPIKPAMTREELLEAIDELYDDPLVSQRQHRLAVDLGLSLATILSWRSGRRLPQGPARAAIQLMLKKKRLQT